MSKENIELSNVIKFFAKFAQRCSDLVGLFLDVRFISLSWDEAS